MSDVENCTIALLQAAFILKSEAANAKDPDYKSALEKSAHNVKVAADEIERLREALRSIEGQAVCVALPHKATEADDMLENIAGIAARALELKGNQ